MPCPEEDLYWEFACSENDSQSRHGDAWRSRLGLRLSAVLDRGAREELGPADWRRIASTLREVRGWYISELLDLGPGWFRGTLRTGELGRVRLIRHAPFRAIAPNLLLDEFVRALDSGSDTPEDRFAGRYRLLRDRFDPARMRGRPILIGESADGPFTEADGLTRMSILWSRRTRGQSAPESLEVLVGLAPDLARWRYF